MVSTYGPMEDKSVTKNSRNKRRTFSLVVYALLVSMLSACGGGGNHHGGGDVRSSGMTWKFSDECNDGLGVQLQFFDETNHLVWPGGGNAYILNPGGSGSASLACKAGAKICYGATTRPPTASYWGVGIDNNRGCDKCCAHCSSGEVTPIALRC